MGVRKMVPSQILDVLLHCNDQRIGRRGNTTLRGWCHIEIVNKLDILSHACVVVGERRCRVRGPEMKTIVDRALGG